MKFRLSLVLFVVLTLTVAVNSSAQEFTLNTTSANLVASKSTFDLPGLAYNPGVTIVATPLLDPKTFNPHPIGAWYYIIEWNIFKTDHTTMPPDLKSKLEAFLRRGANQSVHIISQQNFGNEGPYIDHPLLNNKPDPQFKILQNHAPSYRSHNFLNQFEAKAVYYSSLGKWFIQNVNGNPLVSNMAYNIVVYSDDGRFPTSPQLPSLTVAVTRTRMPIIPTDTQPPTTSTTVPCTKETAFQTVGKWGKQKLNDTAQADPSFPEEQYPLVLAKAQKVIELFKVANPEFRGIQASAQRGIRGKSYFPNGAMPFRVDVLYESYFCVPNDTSKVEMRGKVILYSNYGTTTVYFNSLRDVLESVQEGRVFLTIEGEEIFEYKKQMGEFKGFTMIQPLVRDEENHEAVIIAPDNRLPYKPVTREQYLLARIKNHGTENIFAADVASLKSAIAGMSPAERQTPAIVRNITASPGRAKLFVTEDEGGRHLVTIDKSFFNPKLAREIIQFITVHWSWDDKIPPKVEAIRQFKHSFDFEALRQMLGK